MASFPAVVERVKHWDEEVKKAQYFVKELEKSRDSTRWVLNRSSTRL
jgi:Cys-tRNA synthase (O-phospho-L-seryl-tRNA:Cys-tRNA synthase)